MKLWDNFINKVVIPRITKGIGPLKDDSRIYRSLRQVLAAMGTNIAYPYTQSIWVYSSVNTIAQNISKVPFRMYKQLAVDDYKAIERGPLYELFLNPNPYMTTKTLFEATMVYMGLRGEAFWILEGRSNVTEIPKSIWTFDPERFEPFWDKNDNTLLGWVYRGKEEIVIPAENVIHFKYFNPYDDIRGCSPLKAAEVSIDQDYYASHHNKNFFKNGAAVGGYISVEGELSDDSYNRLLNQLEDRHKGYDKAHRIAVLENNGKFSEMKISNRDMDFVNMKKLSRQEIFAAYKTNDVVLGQFSEIQSYEGIRAAHKAFWEECLIPKIEYIEEVLWAKFFSKVDGGRVWGGFDLATVGALQDDYTKKLQNAQLLFLMGYPINMINRRLGLGMQEVPWGETWWKDATTYPVDTSAKPPKDTNSNNSDKNKNLSHIYNDSDRVISAIRSRIKNNDNIGNLNYTNILEGFDKIKNLIETETETKVKEVEAQHIYFEKLFVKKLGRFFFEQRKKTIEKLHESKEISVIFDKKAEEERLVKFLEPLYALCSQHTKNVSLDKTSLRSKQIAKELVRIVNDRIENTLKTGFAKKESVDELSDRIRFEYNNISTRAGIVAKTEVKFALGIKGGN